MDGNLNSGSDSGALFVRQPAKNSRDNNVINSSRIVIILLWFKINKINTAAGDNFYEHGCVSTNFFLNLTGDS